MPTGGLTWQEEGGYHCSPFVVGSGLSCLDLKEPYRDSV
jgi:hypothetical protein